MKRFGNVLNEKAQSARNALWKTEQGNHDQPVIKKMIDGNVGLNTVI